MDQEKEKEKSLQDKYNEIMQGQAYEGDDAGSLAQPYEVEFVESYTTNYVIDPEEYK